MLLAQREERGQVSPRGRAARHAVRLEQLFVETIDGFSTRQTTHNVARRAGLGVPAWIPAFDELIAVDFSQESVGHLNGNMMRGERMLVVNVETEPPIKRRSTPPYRW